MDSDSIWVMFVNKFDDSENKIQQLDDFVTMLGYDDDLSLKMSKFSYISSFIGDEDDKYTSLDWEKTGKEKIIEKHNTLLIIR